MCASARHSYRIEYLCSVKSLRPAPSEKSRSDHCAPVAQMDRALASGAKGRGFESLLARHLLNPVAFLPFELAPFLNLRPICFPWPFTYAFALDVVDRSEDKA